jgi:hypothetical protein
MILNKVDFLWDNEPKNLQMLKFFFFCGGRHGTKTGFSLTTFQSSPPPSLPACRIILPLLYDHSFIYRQRHVILTINSVVK